MKTPEEIKKGLECCMDYQCCTEYGEPKCPYNEATKCMDALLADSLAYIQQLEDAIDKTTQLMQSATEVIKKNQEQIESTYSQVKKALCGKENATLDELLQAVNQLKARLAQVERERDAALKDIANTCWSCANAKPHQLSRFLYSCPYLKGKAGVRTQCEHWQWRGPCPENTKEELS